MFIYFFHSGLFTVVQFRIQTDNISFVVKKRVWQNSSLIFDVVIKENENVIYYFKSNGKHNKNVETLVGTSLSIINNVEIIDC